MGPGARKGLAVLAAGVVLAGGGVTTLASWQDETYGKAPLTLSSFNVQQSTGGTWVEADTEALAGTLDLTVQGTVGALLAPGGATTGWVALRAAPGSLGGTVTMAGATLGVDPSGLAPFLRYQAVSGVSRQDCSAGTLSGGTALVAAGSALTAAGSTSVTLNPGAGGAAGAEVGICLKLTLQDGISRTLGSAALSPVWRFSAVSAG